ncbi:MAG: class I SAM-dependent methyltransferase [Pseudomonadota bacterium]
MTRRADWTGAVGDVWSAEWRRTDRSFADLSRHLDAAILDAVPAAPFTALDIGCGAGGTSLSLAAARPDARIVGIDLSAGLVEVARARATRTENSPLAAAPTAPVGQVAFHVGDASVAAPGLGPFDLLYSRHGVMFFDDPVPAFTALRGSARSGAGLVFSCFAHWADNDFARAIAAAIEAPPPIAGAPGPFAFADTAHVAAILAAAGWRDAQPRGVPFAYRAGEGDDAQADALSFFRRIGPAAAILRTAAPADRAGLLARIAAVIADHHVGNAIDFPALAWIWSARA